MLSRNALSIGYLVQQFPPEVGAGPARVYELGTRWLAQGAKLTVVTGMPNRPQGRIHSSYRGRVACRELWDGIPVLRSWLYASPTHGFARTLANNLSFMVSSSLLGALRLPPCDVLIASSPPFFPHVAGAFVGAVRNFPLVLEIRDLWPDYLVGMGVLGDSAASALFRVERWLLARAARVVVVTESFRRRVVEKGVPEDRVDVISNGVDLAQYFATDEAPPIPALEREGNEFIVGYLGNFGVGQALSTVVEAAALLGDAHAEIRFVLVGDGPDLRNVADLLRRTPKARASLHPPIAKNQTRAFYNACDVCLVPLAPVPIFQETVPSKLFEVMACERPVLASLEGEGAQIVRSSQSGITVPPGEPGALAAGILRLQSLSADTRRAMGERGRRFVNLHYNRDELSGRYLHMLDRHFGGR